LFEVNEGSLALPQVKSAANFNERHCRRLRGIHGAVRCGF
jgi:hypothetical protein